MVSTFTGSHRGRFAGCRNLRPASRLVTDGRYIAFSIGRGNGIGLYLIQDNGGKMVGSLTEEEGNATDPAWSWWLGE